MWISQSKTNSLYNKINNIYVDTDVLNCLFANSGLYKSLIFETLNNKNLIVTQFTRFEFLRSVYMPEIRTLKEEILDKDFLPGTPHQKAFSEIKENSMVLSMVYANKKVAKGASLADLLLAGRIMLQYKNSLLLTGNRKDFPSTVFDIEKVFNYEEKDGHLRSLCILSFNKNKFDAAIKPVTKLKEQYKKKMETEKRKELENLLKNMEI